MGHAIGAPEQDDHIQRPGNLAADRAVIDAHGGQVLLDVADLTFCDASGLGALARMSRHAGQTGSSLHLVAPPPRLMKIIRITGLEDTLPVHREGRAGQAQVA